MRAFAEDSPAVEDDQHLAAAPQGVLQEPRQLAVPVGDVLRLLLERLHPINQKLPREQHELRSSTGPHPKSHKLTWKKHRLQ